MEIQKDLRNELFKRQEIVGVVESEKNPTIDEIKEEVSAKLKKPKENIDVLRLLGSFGMKKFKFEAQVYDSEVDLKSALESRKSKKQKDADKKASEPPKEEKTD